ncbi:MAG: flavodoxin-dependent (E)-4-hydroxy-3-methylbut-2-enyl-diphosphate synthase [Acutalibacteraceae bacterium]|nr:flavodoxin-dependent (E)-4-hydroxy-3-methylbut-2-enyl-diphosphate synthase [Acutalibacteraceae bacterium]
MRRESIKIKVGNTYIGSNAPVSVQSMLNVPSYDIKGSVEQALKLESAGCDIIRAAVPDIDSVKLIDALKNSVKVPIVADIHFDYKIAVECANAGVDKIRINPGNIGSDEKVKAVADICNQKNIPIRIGVNSGSVEKSILAKYGAPTASALVDSALYHASLLEKFDFNNIVISVKSSDTLTTYNAYIEAAQRCNYPLHLGVTEAGTLKTGIIKSSSVLGGLLLQGIGDTIRVSLTDEPLEEVYAGIDILKSVGLRKQGIQIVSCPTCGRTRIDLVSIAKRAEELLKNCNKELKVAIMGCAVNGPGEAKEADVGIAGADGCGVIIKKGKIIRKVPEDKLLEELMIEIERM